MESLDLALKIAEIIDSKKAEDIKILKLSELTDSFEYFVIATCLNSRQMDATIDEVENILRDNYNERPYLIEGQKEGNWALVDFGPVVLHLFQDETRSFYRLEHLWSEAQSIDPVL